MAGKLVVLKLDGNLQGKGFRVTLEVGNEEQRPQKDCVGDLPAAPDLADAIARYWKEDYRSLEGTNSRAIPGSEQINNELWEQYWDIIFFAGHSKTEGEAGVIYINPSEALPIRPDSVLWYGLREAVKRGLKLVIFNSGTGKATRRFTHSPGDFHAGTRRRFCGSKVFKGSSVKNMQK